MVELHCGDCLDVLKTLADASVHCAITSPPYWGLRDYGVAGQLGLEKTPEEYVGRMVEVFREVRRVLRDDGTLWLNLGDSYTSGGRTTQCQPTLRPGQTGVACRAPVIDSLKPKDLIGIPWRVALALQADGWYLRSDIIWHKPNPMPESVRDRPTKSHEYLFLLSKGPAYYFDADAVREEATAAKHNGRYGPSKVVKLNSDRKDHGAGRFTPPAGSGRNIRTVWTVATRAYKGCHFATFPPKLVEPCIKAGCPEGGTVLDPFAGSGTTGAVAKQLGRSFVGIELKPAYLELARQRIAAAEADAPLFAGAAS